MVVGQIDGSGEKQREVVEGLIYLVIGCGEKGLGLGGEKGEEEDEG